VLAHPLTGERLAPLGIALDGVLTDGQRVVLAGDPPFPVRVVHSPGHTRGHLAFLDESYGSLIAGDVLSGLSTIVIDPPEGDMEEFLATLAKLRDLAPRVLFPGHGPVLAGAVARLEETRQHRMMREERVLAAWHRGLRSPAEIVGEAYDALDPRIVPLAERQVLAHLERLRRLDRLAP
jgi:glyoxylase-like metal-dependent hydrolase (beta-lactamase superfamily II)